MSPHLLIPLSEVGNFVIYYKTKFTKFRRIFATIPGEQNSAFSVNITFTVYSVKIADFYNPPLWHCSERVRAAPGKCAAK